MLLVPGLQIAPGGGAGALTPEQKRFNTLIRQLGQARRLFQAWQENIPPCLQRYAKTIVPLLQALRAAQREQVLALDRLLDRPDWNRAERATLIDLVCAGAGALVQGEGSDDAAMKAVFDKHAAVDFDTAQQRSRQDMKDTLEQMTGLDLGDAAGIGSDDDLFARLRAEMADGAAQDAAAARRRRKGGGQQRREAEAQLAARSVRDLMRKLASALHPDRELDPARRDAKTALLQRANQAYAANDLLTLLELQLEVEHVDAGRVAAVGAQQLTPYNRLLAEQLAGLKNETARVEARFRQDLGLAPGWGLNPARLGGLIGPAARELRDGLEALRQDMRQLADVATTRRWLKAQRRRLREDDVVDQLLTG